MLAIVGVLIAVGGFVVLDRAQRDHLTVRAETEAAAAMSALTRQIERDVAGMVTVGVNAVDPRGRDEASWARPLELIAAEGGLQAVSGVNLAQPLTAAQLGRLPSSVRDELDLRLGDGPEHLVVTHVWPEATNAAARGYDVLRNEVAAEAATAAFAEGRVVSSAPTTLVQDSSGGPAIIAYVPVLGASQRVVALATVNFEPQALVDQVVTMPPGMQARWVDVETGDALGHTPPLSHHYTVSVRHTAEVVGRTWAVDVRATTASLGATSRFAPWTAVGLGLTLTGFAVITVLRARRDRERALRLVAERTAELEATARSLSRVNARLESADRDKDELLAAVSHDLRTPLTVISGYASTLTSAHNATPEDLRRGLAGIRRQTGRLEALVDDLLAVSRLDAPDAVTAEDLELAVAVHDVVDDLGVGEVRIVDDDVVVHADRFHVERIVANLLMNAVKHGGPPYQVEVEAAGGAAVLRVRDHGEGIPLARREEVFRPFTQLGGGRAGVGLGLSIAARLAEANGGVLRYEEPEAGGASFVFTLPRARVRADSDPGVEVGSSPGPGRSGW